MGKQSKQSDTNLDIAQNTASIPYTVRVSRRARRLQVKVTSYGDIEVVLPHRMSPRHIEPFVSIHRDWIIETRTKLIADRLKVPSVHQPLPERIPLKAIDSDYLVRYSRVATSHRNRIIETGRWLTVVSDSETRAAELLRGWLSGKARDSLLPWLSRVSDELGLEFGKAVIRGQKTRWGSCSSSGTISLNRALLLLDSNVVRYVFVHELCHTVCMNHSRRFWKLVKSHEPDYRHYEQQLNSATMLMPLWLQQSRRTGSPG